MKNPKSAQRVASAAREVCNEQGGSYMEGKSSTVYGPEGIHEKFSGHESASSAGVAGNCYPGKKGGKEKSPGTGGY